MDTSQPGAGQPFRIGAQEVLAYLETGRPMLVLDARSTEAWNESPVQIRGAVRIDRDRLRIDSSWSKDRLTVVYCT